MTVILLAGSLIGPGRLAPANTPATAAAPESPKPPRIELLTISAVGDVMMHDGQLIAGLNPKSGEYDFRPFFAEVKEIVSVADIAVANLETTLAGKDRRFTGYPMFNSPDEYAEALKDAGFDVITTANNHSLDRFASGAVRTLDVLDRYGLVPTGTARDQEERDRIPTVEKKDIRVAFLAYTYGTNGIPIPPGKEYLVNLIDPKTIEADVRRARETGADVVVTSLHFGNEYQRQPSPEQRQLAEQVAAMGVDIILGSHTHVLQPAETLITGSGDREREHLVIYSMGNFISAQKPPYRDSGVIWTVTLEKNFETGRTRIAKAEFVPTWVHRYSVGKRPQYRVLPVQAAIRAFEDKTDRLLTEADYRRLGKVLQETTSHLGSIPTRRIIESDGQ
jgi:poly-gamma-glutamate synthesis protein (capsule biosynthesis protein)